MTSTEDKTQNGRRDIQEITVPNFNCDRNGLMTANAFQTYAQESLYKHTNQLGAGHEPLAKAGLFWALIRFRFQFIRHPKWEEEIELSSWFSQRKGPYWIRETKMVSRKTGETLAIGSAMWIIMNANTRSADRGNVLSESVIIDEKTFDSPCSKITVPESADCLETMNHSVKYSDMDTNGHANNCMYIRWAMDGLDYDYCVKNPVKDVQMTLDHEILPGQEVSINKYNDRVNDKIWYFIGEKDGVKAFSMKVEFI